MARRDPIEILYLHPVKIGTLVNFAAIPFLAVMPVSFLLSGYFSTPVAPPSAPPSAFDPYLNFVSLTIGAPLSEEMLFRGLLLTALAKRSPFWPAAIFVNVLWTAMHWHYPVLGLATTFTLGLLFSFALRRTGSLWTAIAAHALCNLEPALVPLLFSASL